MESPLYLEQDRQMSHSVNQHTSNLRLLTALDMFIDKIRTQVL